MKDLTRYSMIDVHYHASPDLYDRRYNALTAGRIYAEHNSAVILKSHLGSTAVQATLAQSEGLPVLPSIVLNEIAGGLNIKSIINALLNYKPQIKAKMIVHLPTITGKKHKSSLKRRLSFDSYQEYSQQTLCVFDENNKLKKSVIDIIKLCNDEPLVLSTGHASKEETYALIEETSKYKNVNLMLNQPANPLTGLNAEDLKQISKYSHVFPEQTLLTVLLGYQDEKDFERVLTEIPQAIFSSDLGQTSQMDIESYFKLSKNLFKQFNLSEHRVKEIWKHNIVKMLGT